MCEKCAAAVKKYYPQLSEDAAGDFLLTTTCLPFGTAEDVERQLKEMKENTDGSIGAALAYADKAVSDSMDKFSKKRRVEEALDHLVSLLPEWSQYAEKGHDATMYGTGTYEGDVKVVEKTNKSIQTLKMVVSAYKP